MTWSKQGTHCVWCAKPLATDGDYEAIPDGEGTHLCWSRWTVECESFTGSVAALLADLRGQIERASAPNPKGQ